MAVMTWSDSRSRTDRPSGIASLEEAEIFQRCQGRLMDFLKSMRRPGQVMSSQTCLRRSDEICRVDGDVVPLQEWADTFQR